MAETFTVTQTTDPNADVRRGNSAKDVVNGCNGLASLCDPIAAAPLGDFGSGQPHALIAVNPQVDDWQRLVADPPFARGRARGGRRHLVGD